MTIKQLQYFVSVCRTENLTASAKELFISQPTLSLTIKELEEEAGAELFTKKGNRLFLSDAGRRLQAEAEAVLAQFGRLNEVITGGKLRKSYIRIGFSTFTGSTVMPELVSRFSKANPGLEILAYEDTGEALLGRLEAGGLDAVLTGGRYAESANWKGKFEGIDLKRTDLRYCRGTDSIAEGKKRITLEEIASEPLVMLDRNFPLAKTIEDLFASAGLDLNVILRTSQMFTVESFVTEGAAGGFLPLGMAENNRKIRVLSCPEIDSFRPYPSRLFWKAENRKQKVISALLAAVEGTAQTAAPDIP